MKDDINSGFENLVEVDSKTVATILPGIVLNKTMLVLKVVWTSIYVFRMELIQTNGLLSLSRMVTLSHL